MKKRNEAVGLAKRLRLLHAKRKTVMAETPRRVRKSLSKAFREEVLKKADTCCHLCGGEIASDEAWQADHVRPHITGGKHEVANYLPAHALCNNYRWHYSPEEFQWILKLGVWLRTQIARETVVGQKAEKAFAAHETHRERRQRRFGLNRNFP